MHFYDVRAEVLNREVKYFADFLFPNYGMVSVEISETIKNELIDLQREFWRLEKREQRHAVHLEAIPEVFLQNSRTAITPEDALMKKLDSRVFISSFLQLPLKQQRRMLLRYVYDLPIKTIAELENCSDRAIKYSLKLAKKNLKDILGEDFLRS